MFLKTKKKEDEKSFIFFCKFVRRNKTHKHSYSALAQWTTKIVSYRNEYKKTSTNDDDDDDDDDYKRV